MDTILEAPPAVPSTLPVPVPAELPIAPNLTARRTRNGKIARLPKATRDKLNLMLQDNLQYKQIIEVLSAELPEDINEDNISTWRAGGYQDWVRDQRRLEAIRLKQDFMTDLVASGDSKYVHQAAMRIAATQLCELLVDFDPVVLRESLEQHPDTYARLLHVTARLSDGQIHSERHQRQEAEADAKSAKENAAAKNPGVSDESLALAAERLAKL